MKKYMQTILCACVFAGMPYAYAAQTNQSQGEIFTTGFAPHELPDKPNVDLFKLGKIAQPVTLKKIAAPSRHEAFVQFNFETEGGTPVDFLIRRVVLPRERFNKLKARNRKTEEFRHNMAARLGNDEGIITSFYFRHAASNEQSKEWIEMYSVTDKRNAYRFNPTFDARIYPNGLVVLDVRGKENLLFGTGEKTAQQLLVSPEIIEIGNGKTATAKEIAFMNI